MNAKIQNILNRLKSSNSNQSEIAAEYGVSRAYVSQLKGKYLAKQTENKAEIHTPEYGTAEENTTIKAPNNENSSRVKWGATSSMGKAKQSILSGLSGRSTHTVIDRIKAREDAAIFRPEIQEGMTAAQIMEQYDRFKGNPVKRQTRDYPAPVPDHNEDARLED